MKFASWSDALSGFFPLEHESPQQWQGTFSLSKFEDIRSSGLMELGWLCHISDDEKV